MTVQRVKDGINNTKMNSLKASKDMFKECKNKFLNKTNIITITTFSCERDGLTIRGTEYKPQGENLPIAIVSHGFMAFQDTVRQYAKALAEMGYAAYCFDFCGGSVVKGKSDGKTTDMSVLTEVKDLESVIDYTKGQAYTDENHILLMGCSQGGFVSAITAAKRKQEIEKLILFYPALCIPDDARAGKMMLAKFDPHNIPKLLNCGPMKLGRCYVSDVIEMNPYEEIKDFAGDVLIVHGTKDDIVKLEYSQKAYETYLGSEKYLGSSVIVEQEENSEAVRNDELADRRVVFEIIEDGRHGFSKKHDKIAIEMIRRFASNE